MTTSMEPQQDITLTEIYLMGLVISPISGVYKHIHSFGQLNLFIN